MDNVKKTLNGYRLTGELKDVPVAFVNALRRILLSDIPTVVVQNVEILENSTNMTHEMLKHRVSMLPVNVRATEMDVIRDTRIELRYLEDKEKEREITSDDFVVTGPRKEILLRDRDLGEPMFFMNLLAGQSLHIKATLGLVTQGASQVCVSTFMNHIDPTLRDLDRDRWIQGGGDPREFDNHHFQRSYSRDENGRPNWFDFTVESIGVTPAVDLLKTACEILKTKVLDFAAVPVQREQPNWYRIEMEGETFTVGQLVQEILYKSGLVEFVSRDVGHPLRPVLTIHFNSKMPPENVVERFKTEAVALCENVLKSV